MSLMPPRLWPRARGSRSSKNGATKHGLPDRLSLGPSRRPLIHEQPIQSQHSHGLGELGKVDGFDNVAVGAVLVTRRQVSFLLGRCQDDDGQPLCGLVRADPAQYVETAYLWKVQIQKNDLRQIHGVACRVGTAGEDVVESLGPVAGHENLVHDVRLL